MVWRSRRVGAKVRVTASVKLLPVPSARIPCFINVHQHNKRCREVRPRETGDRGLATGLREPASLLAPRSGVGDKLAG